MFFDTKSAQCSDLIFNYSINVSSCLDLHNMSIIMQNCAIKLKLLEIIYRECNYMYCQQHISVIKYQKN